MDCDTAGFPAALSRPLPARVHLARPGLVKGATR